MSLITLSFKHEELELILDTVKSLDQVVASKLSLSVMRDRRRFVDLTPDEVQELIEALDDTMAILPRVIRRKLGSIQERVIRRSGDLLTAPETLPELSDFSQSEFDFSAFSNLKEGADLPEAFENIFREQLGSKWDQFSQTLHSSIGEFFATPQANFGGLTAKQMVQLNRTDYRSDSSPVRLNRNLPIAELEGCEVLVNARLFLKLLQELGGTKSDRRGGLSREFVQTIFTEFRWPEVPSLDPKVREDSDLLLLYHLHAFLQLGGLIQREKRRITITEFGSELLLEANAGQLYAELFITFLTEFDHVNLAPLPEIDPIQDTYAYTLYRLSALSGKWIHVRELPKLVLFESEEGKRVRESSYPDNLLPTYMAYSRVIRPLTRFGLIECQYEPEPDVLGAFEPKRVRTTPLFSRFLSFHMDNAERP